MSVSVSTRTRVHPRYGKVSGMIDPDLLRNYETRESAMRDILRQTFANALLLLRQGEPIVEITDAP